jgi:hypothetical protein
VKWHKSIESWRFQSRVACDLSCDGIEILQNKSESQGQTRNLTSSLPSSPQLQEQLPPPHGTDENFSLPTTMSSVISLLLSWDSKSSIFSWSISQPNATYVHSKNGRIRYPCNQYMRNTKTWNTGSSSWWKDHMQITQTIIIWEHNIIFIKIQMAK